VKRNVGSTMARLRDVRRWRVDGYMGEICSNLVMDKVGTGKICRMIYDDSESNSSAITQICYQPLLLRWIIKKTRLEKPDC